MYIKKILWNSRDNHHNNHSILQQLKERIKYFITNDL